MVGLAGNCSLSSFVQIAKARKKPTKTMEFRDHPGAVCDSIPETVLAELDAPDKPSLHVAACNIR